MIKKAQGLMNESEIKALLSNYDIYLVNKIGNTIEYDDMDSIKLNLGGGSYKGIENYTIDSRDYNLLMKIAEKFQQKLTLYVIITYGNEFTIEDYAVEVKVAPPTTTLNKYNIRTKINRPKRIYFHRRELLTSPNAFDAFSQGEEVLDDVLKNVTRFLEENNLPLKPLSVEDYMSSSDHFFTLIYNTNMLKDPYIKGRNIVFPTDFTNGFEKFFTEEGIKRVLRKIRKIINRAGNREEVNLDPISRVYYTSWTRNTPISESEQHAIFINNFTVRVEGRTEQYLSSEEIKELGPTVFDNMRNYILSGMENYYKTRGFSRPLTTERLTARGISREVNSLIRTAVVSSLPGFQTSQGQQRGYTFNKSVRIDPASQLSFMEAVIRKDPRVFDLMGIRLGTSGGSFYLGNQPLPESQRRLFMEALTVPALTMDFENSNFRFKQGGKDMYIVHDDKVDMTYLFLLRKLKDVFEAEPNTSLNELLKKSGALVALSTSVIRFLPSIIKSLFNDASAEDTINEEGGFIVPITTTPKGGAREALVKMFFKFSFTEEIEDSFYVIKSLRLESVEVSIYRRRNLNRTFEIDINAEYGFDLEIRRVVNRILNAEDFYSADRPNINPSEKSAAFIQKIVRSMNLPTVINVEPPAYDSLTGSTRGMWLIFSEGFDTTYLSIDDRQAGMSGSKRHRYMRGSACVGMIRIHRVPNKDEYDSSATIEHDGKFYYLDVRNSECINLTFPVRTTKREVVENLAEEEGKEVYIHVQNKIRGPNLDPLGTTSLAALTTGSKLGQPPMLSEYALQEAKRAHIPAQPFNRATIGILDLSFHFPTNVVAFGSTNVSQMDPSSPAWDGEFALEISDPKILYRFLASGYRHDEVKEKLDEIDNPAMRHGSDAIKLTNEVFEILGLTYDAHGHSGDPIREVIGRSIYDSLSSSSLKITTIEEIKPVIEANKEEVAEILLRNAGLGADYAGSDTHPDEDYSYMEEATRRVKRRREIE